MCFIRFEGKAGWCQICQYEIGNFVKYYQDGVKIVERRQIDTKCPDEAWCPRGGEICFLELSHHSRRSVHQKLSRYKLQVSLQARFPRLGPHSRCDLRTERNYRHNRRSSEVPPSSPSPFEHAGTKILPIRDFLADRARRRQSGAPICPLFGRDRETFRFIETH